MLGTVTANVGRSPRAVTAGVLGVLVCAVIVAPEVHHWLFNEADQRLVDLDVYRSAGQSVLIGRPVYGYQTPPPQLLPFTYPPVAALAAVPLALVPWGPLQWLWIVLVFVALGVSVWYAFRAVLARAGHLAPALAALLVAAMAYLMPVHDQIRFGQVDVLLVAACLLDCMVKKPRWPRGLLIGLATAVKLTPGVFIIYLWLTGRRRAAYTAALTVAGAVAVAFLVIPGDSADYWFRALFDSERLGANKGTSNQSLRGMLLRLYLPDPVTTVLWLAALALVAYVGFRVARRVSLAGDEPAGVAVTGLLAVLLSPVAWIHHLAWVVVAVAALLGDGRDRRRVAAAAACWVYYVLTVPWYGVALLSSGTGPYFLARMVQDGFGLGAIALIPLLRWSAGSGKRSHGCLVRSAARSAGARRSRFSPLPRVRRSRVLFARFSARSAGARRSRFSPLPRVRRSRRDRGALPSSSQEVERVGEHLLQGNVRDE